MSKRIAQPIDFGPDGFEPVTPRFSEGSDESSGLGAVNNLESFLSTLIGFLTVLGGVFFVIYFIIGAFEWITGGGDSGKIQKARDKMIQGVIGLIVMVAAYGIIGLIGSIIGLNLLRPAEELLKLGPTTP